MSILNASNSPGGFRLNNKQSYAKKNNQPTNEDYHLVKEGMREAQEFFKRDIAETGMSNSSYINPQENNEYINNPNNPGMGSGDRPMDEDTFVASCRAQYEDAQLYIDGWIGPKRASATSFYKGGLYGPQEEGRSNFVMTEVRDTVQQILPDIMSIFTSSEQVVEFIPTNQNTVELAQQQTDYVNYVFMEDNHGYNILLSAFTDALIQGNGFIKWRWSEDKKVTEQSLSGITVEQVAMLQQDPTVQIVDLVEDPNLQPSPPTMPGVSPLPPNPITYSFKMRRSINKNGVVVEALPPWEFLIARDARDIPTASFVAHRKLMFVSDVVAMGYPLEVVEEHMGGGNTVFDTNWEQQATNPAVINMDTLSTPDETMRKVLFVEAYVRVDKDGDGIAELHKIHAIGEINYILDDEVVDEAPFVTFSPVPIPHTALGEGIYDQTADIQMLKSSVMRGVLDSLAESIHPRTVVVDGQVNMDDAMNTEHGAIIRVKSANSLSELTKPFNGADAMPVLTYIDNIKAKRTGVSDASQGLDPNVLQGTATEGVVATVNSANQRIVMYARNFAEGIQRMFVGISNTIAQNQDQSREVLLNGGKWTNIDPRSWINDLDCTVNVALGKGTDADKQKVMALVLQKQEAIMATGGQFNALAGIDKYSATLQQLLNLSGIKNASKYFNDITPQQYQQMAQMQQQTQQAPPPNPQLIAAQVAVAQQQQEASLAERRFAWEQQKDIADQQFEREKELLDAYVKLQLGLAAHGQKIDQAAWDSLVQHQDNVANQQIATMQMGLNHIRSNQPTNVVDNGAPGPYPTANSSKMVNNP